MSSKRNQKPKQVGIFVPPAQPRPQTADARAAKNRSRTVNKGFLDAEPVAAPGTSLTDILEHKTADWVRRREQHLVWLETATSSSVASSFFKIREYIHHEPYWMVGDWVERDTEPDDDGVFQEAHWAWHPYWLDLDGSDNGSGRLSFNAAIDEVRRHLIETFREVLGKAVCPHGDPWENWKPSPVDGKGSGCENCRVEHLLVEKGKDPNLANFPDARDTGRSLLTGKPRENVRSANTILSMLGLGKWAAYTPTTSPDKLVKIDAAQKRDELVGGKRVSASSQVIDRSTGKRNQGALLGPDSSDQRGEDKTAGSQDDSKLGNGDQVVSEVILPGDKEQPVLEKFDTRKLPRSPGFDSLPA